MALPFDHTHDLVLEVLGQDLKYPYFRNGRADWVIGHNGHKPKWAQVKWPGTETSKN